jgi:hypothetical protein
MTIFNLNKEARELQSAESQPSLVRSLSQFVKLVRSEVELYSRVELTFL